MAIAPFTEWSKKEKHNEHPTQSSVQADSSSLLLVLFYETHMQH